MSCLIFAPLLLLASAAVAAQEVPGRDLLEFPIGTLAEAPPLARDAGGGLWNPATLALRRPDLVRVSLSALNSPIEQGVSSALVTVGVSMPRDLTLGASVAHAQVSDIFRTSTDPSTHGEIPYSTTLLSVGATAARGTTSVGVAARYRSGTADAQSGGVFALDAGFVADRAFHSPIRLGASTFLFSPTARREESATYEVGADVPLTPLLAHADSTWALRAGASYSKTEERGSEAYLFSSARYRMLDARVGVCRGEQFGSTSQRLRLALGLHYARYAVAISREDNGAGLGASYQFLLATVFR